MYTVIDFFLFEIHLFEIIINFFCMIDPFEAQFKFVIFYKYTERELSRLQQSVGYDGRYCSYIGNCYRQCLLMWQFYFLRVNSRSSFSTINFDLIPNFSKDIFWFKINAEGGFPFQVESQFSRAEKNYVQRFSWWESESGTWLFQQINGRYFKTSDIFLKHKMKIVDYL